MNSKQIYAFRKSNQHLLSTYCARHYSSFSYTINLSNLFSKYLCNSDHPHLRNEEIVFAKYLRLVSPGNRLLS